MPTIIIKGSYGITGKIQSSKKKVSVLVATPDKQEVSVDIFPEDNLVEATQEVEVSNELLGIMENNRYSDLSDELEVELSAAISGVSSAARRVLHLIKYCFNNYQMDEALMSVKDVSWSNDRSSWHRILQRFNIAATVIGTLDLDENRCKRLQDYIDSDFQPFLALRHLHRARKEQEPRHKWIEATIAAELAIKEFLIRYKPELETLLLQVPAPPLDKMYGKILKEYAGEVLPKKTITALKEGAETRNHLIHRPQEEAIDLQEALDYVSIVAEAIKFLLNILYPEHHLVV